MDTNKENPKTHNGDNNNKPEAPNTDTPQTNEETGREQEGKKMSWQLVLTVIAIIAIILVFALPSNKDEVVTLDENGEEIVVEDSEINEDGEIIANTATGNAIKSMTPIVDGDDFVYSFQGIDWFLETVDGGTAVKFKFSEFSRREGSIVAFGNPYRLGVFDGKCTEVSHLDYDSTVNSDTPLAFVTCLNDEGNGSDIALFQDGAKVYGSQRNTNEGVTGEFSEFFSRDITTIVR